MRYPYFDILIAMAKANVAPTNTLRLLFIRRKGKSTRLGPQMGETAYYTTPEGDVLIEDANGGTHYES